MAGGNLSGHGVKVITVTGGKGGVGKSSVSLNMAIAMSAQGKRVMLLDADLGLARLVGDTLALLILTIICFINGDSLPKDLSQLAARFQPVMTLPVILVAVGAFFSVYHFGLIRAFSELKTPVDVLIVDTAAGISDMVLAFARAAQDVLVVVCDEPTSVTDAYALMKILNTEYGVSRFKIVANMVNSLRQGKELFAKLTKVTDRFLDVALELVSCVPMDNNIRLALRKRQVIVDAFPKSPAAMAFKALALRAATWPIPYRPEGHLEFFVENLVKRSVANDGDGEEKQRSGT